MHKLLAVVFVLVVFGVRSQSSAVPQTDSVKKEAEKSKVDEAPALFTDTVELEEKSLESPASAKSVKTRKKVVSASDMIQDQENTLEEISIQAESDNVASGAVSNSSTFINASNSFEYSRDRATEQRYQRSPSPAMQQEMDEAVGYFEQNAPNSFEYNYFKYSAGNYDVNLESNLAEAERLRPNNSDVQVQYAALNMIKGDMTAALQYLERLIDSGRLTTSALEYSEDILRSTPQNGTLITHGFDDTYGSYYMQAANGVRTDVELVSLDFLQSDAYRDRLKEKGYQLPSSTQVDVNYFAGFCQLNAGRKIAVSMTTPKEYFSPVMSNLYATGVVFEYHSAPFDNFSRNAFLWDNGLRKKSILQPSDDKARQLSLNYLPMLIQLRRVYYERGDAAKLAEIDSTIDKIGVQSNKYEQVQKLKVAY